MVGMRVALLAAALALAACSGLEPMRITVESEEFPEVRIECDGEGRAVSGYQAARFGNMDAWHPAGR